MSWKFSNIAVERHASPATGKKTLVSVQVDLDNGGTPSACPAGHAVRGQLSDGHVTVIGQLKAVGKPPRFRMNPKAVPANPVTVALALVDANGKVVAEYSDQVNPA